jgi:hypothetical protein
MLSVVMLSGVAPLRLVKDIPGNANRRARLSTVDPLINGVFSHGENHYKLELF